MTETEGVIKFQLDFESANAAGRSQLGALPAWHRICHRLTLLGQTPERYEGYAYGNLSRRLGQRAFVVSGTQTSGKPILQPDDYALVTDWNIAANRVSAQGPIRPSSESLTHAAIYEYSSSIRYVMHGHSNEIWSRRLALQLPTTDPNALYGTPARAESVWQLLDSGDLGTQGVFAMGGHEDGIIAYGPNADTAGQALVGILAQSLNAR